MLKLVTAMVYLDKIEIEHLLGWHKEQARLMKEAGKTEEFDYHKKRFGALHNAYESFQNLASRIDL